MISPLLANIYFHPLDSHMRERGYRMVRYADDFVLLCRSVEEAQAALTEVKAWVEGNGLSLNADKTQMGDCRQEGQGFEFLGQDQSHTGKQSASHDCGLEPAA